MKKSLLFVVAAGASMMFSCDTKDPETTGPGNGKIELTTDWSQLPQDVVPPTNYIVRIGDYNATLSGKTNIIDNTFSPGDYTCFVYTTTDKVTVSGSSAVVETVDAPAGAAGTFINPQPGLFLASSVDLSIEEGRGVHIMTSVRQQVRDLTVTVEIAAEDAEKISGMTGVLSGVASKLNLETMRGTDPANVALVFEKEGGNAGAETVKYRATARLLDVAGDFQLLDLTTTYSDATPTENLMGLDLTAQLENFHITKSTPLSVDGRAFSIDITSMEFGFAETSSRTVWVNTNSTEWIAGSQQDWIKVEKVDDKSFTVKVDASDEPYARYGTVTVSLGGRVFEIALKQNRRLPLRIDDYYGDYIFNGKKYYTGDQLEESETDFYATDVDNLIRFRNWSQTTPGVDNNINPYFWFVPDDGTLTIATEYIAAANATLNGMFNAVYFYPMSGSTYMSWWRDWNVPVGMLTEDMQIEFPNKYERTSDPAGIYDLYFIVFGYNKSDGARNSRFGNAFTNVVFTKQGPWNDTSNPVSPVFVPEGLESAGSPVFMPVKAPSSVKAMEAKMVEIDLSEYTIVEETGEGRFIWDY